MIETLLLSIAALFLLALAAKVAWLLLGFRGPQSREQVTVGQPVCGPACHDRNYTGYQADAYYRDRLEREQAQAAYANHVTGDIIDPLRRPVPQKETEIIEGKARDRALAEWV